VTGAIEGSWGIYIDGNTGYAFVPGDGPWRWTAPGGPAGHTKDYPAPEVGPIRSLEGYRAGEFNTLAVALQGNDVTIFLTESAVTEPYYAGTAPGVCRCGLMGEKHGKEEVPR